MAVILLLCGKSKASSHPYVARGASLADSQKEFPGPLLEADVADGVTAFKRCWHRADMHPNSNESYMEQNELVSRVLRHGTSERPLQFIHDLGFVNVHPAKDRLVIRDASDARAPMLLHVPQ